MAKPKARFAREDWIELGLGLLSQNGPDALSLESVTAAAGKTRGSFYHHFEDHGAFLQALGQTWLARHTEAVIAAADEAQRRGKRRIVLARRAASLDHALERGLRRMAAREPIIAEAVAAADEKRIAYLAGLFRSELGLAADEALWRARAEHCAFVGAQMVFENADERFRLRLEAVLGAALWRR